MAAGLETMHGISVPAKNVRDISYEPIYRTHIGRCKARVEKNSRTKPLRLGREPDRRCDRGFEVREGRFQSGWNSWPRRSRRRQGEQGVYPRLLGFKTYKSVPLKRGGADRCQRGRVDSDAGAPDFVMQVRSRRLAGLADEPDHLALADGETWANAVGVGRKVGIASLQPARVPDAQPGAVAAPDPGFDHHAVARRQHRRADRSGEVDALMHAAVAEDGMQPHPEDRTDPRALDRRAQQRVCRRRARGIEELGAAVVIESVEPADPVPAAEFGVQQGAGVHRFTGSRPSPPEDEAEAVAGGQIAGEIQPPGEKSRDLFDQGRIGAGALGRIVE